MFDESCIDLGCGGGHFIGLARSVSSVARRWSKQRYPLLMAYMRILFRGWLESVARYPYSSPISILDVVHHPVTDRHFVQGHVVLPHGRWVAAEGHGGLFAANIDSCCVKPR